MMAKVSLKRQLIFTSQKLFLFENLLRLVSSFTYNLLDFISLVKKKQFMITERPQNCRFNKCLTEIWGNFNTPTFPLQLAYSDHINFMNSPLFTIVSLWSVNKITTYVSQSTTGTRTIKWRFQKVYFIVFISNSYYHYLSINNYTPPLQKRTAKISYYPDTLARFISSFIMDWLLLKIKQRSWSQHWPHWPSQTNLKASYQQLQN